MSFEDYIENFFEKYNPSTLNLWLHSLFIGLLFCVAGYFISGKSGIVSGFAIGFTIWFNIANRGNVVRLTKESDDLKTEINTLNNSISPLKEEAQKRVYAQFAIKEIIKVENYINKGVSDRSLIFCVDDLLAILLKMGSCCTIGEEKESIIEFRGNINNVRFQYNKPHSEPDRKQLDIDIYEQIVPLKTLLEEL